MLWLSSEAPGGAVYIVWPPVSMLNTCHNFCVGAGYQKLERQLGRFQEGTIIYLSKHTRRAMCEKTPFVVGAGMGVGDSCWGFKWSPSMRLWGNSRLPLNCKW